MPDPINKTALYDGLPDLPPLVRRAVDAARANGFANSCTPEQGALLQRLAYGRDGGAVGETGTGYGVGLAWMVEAVGPETRFVSVERDDARAASSQALFADCPNVTVLHGDWRDIIPYAPFDLLVLDGGGGAKRAGDEPADPSALLVRGGTVVLDDYHPPLDGWPPRHGSGADSLGRDVDRSRAYWFNHPDLLTTEIRVHPQVGAVIGTRKGG